jgi:hypothetical protein
MLRGDDWGQRPDAGQRRASHEARITDEQSEQLHRPSAGAATTKAAVEIRAVVLEINLDVRPSLGHDCIGEDERALMPPEPGDDRECRRLAQRGLDPPGQFLPRCGVQQLGAMVLQAGEFDIGA